jgi:hypothetical protein
MLLKTLKELYNKLCLGDDALISSCATQFYMNIHKLITPASALAGSALSGVYYYLNDYYNEINECIKFSMHNAIPVKSVHNNQFNIPGWNDLIQDKYDLWREASLTWVSSGRPRCGTILPVCLVLEPHLNLL